MNTNSPFGFDPSQMDPKVLMEISQLIQQLPPDQLNKLQSLMHNAMAGLDVRREMEEFERGLPPGFRDKLTALMVRQGVNPGAMAPMSQPISGAPSSAPRAQAEEVAVPAGELNLHEARLTILRAVANRQMSPEEAEKVLFPEG